MADEVCAVKNIVNFFMELSTELFFRSRQLYRYSINFKYFMEAEGVLPSSQEPCTDPYHEPD
jgi:hypothetical protein